MLGLSFKVAPKRGVLNHMPSLLFLKLLDQDSSIVLVVNVVFECNCQNMFTFQALHVRHDQER